MLAIFIRHGSADAAGADGDAGRKLTPAGREEVRATVSALRAMGIRLDRILTSPLLRAVQSGAIAADVHPDAPAESAEFLAPPGDARAAAKCLAELNEEGAEAVALMGHTPSLEGCIGELVGAGERVGISLSKAGAACVRLPGRGSPDPPELIWLMRREQLAMLAAVK